MSDYHRLPIAQKRTEALARAREPSISCPACDTHVTTADLIAHLEQRRPGRRHPGPGARWINWREAVAIIRRAVPSLSEPAAMMRLSRLFRPDRLGAIVVRSRGAPGDRQYLHFDLVKHVAQQGGVVGTNKSVSEEPSP
jgi:hypothetical protein